MVTGRFDCTVITVAKGGSMDAVDSKVIQVIGAELQDVRVSDARAAELAVEVGRLNAAVLRERGMLRFVDEPAHFARTLDGVAP